MSIPTCLPARIRDRITIVGEHECWQFRGDPSSNGYQRLWNGGKRYMAHIFVWEWVTGKKRPANKTFDHLCENVACCNPDHLEPVPHRVNCIRRTRRRKRVQ